MSTRLQTLRSLISFCLISFYLFIAPGPTATAQPATKTLLTSTMFGEQPLATVGDELPGTVKDKPLAVTTANGDFLFTGLERGTHQLYLDPATLPADLRPPVGAPQVSLWINPGQSLVSDPIGAGVRFSASYDRAGTTIAGVVFLDQDGDGQHDPHEAGLPGVTVIDPTLHQYFVPFDDNDLQYLFAEIYNPFTNGGQCLNRPASASTTMPSFVSVTASDDDTTIYYDHWEDGYDLDPLTPGSTTEIFVINAGVTQTFNDIVATPRTSATFQYDGRDRISILGEPASVTRAVFPSTPGEVLAGAWEIPEVSDWGQRYVTVIGEDLDVNPGLPDDFDYVGLQVMAALSGTQVWRNGNHVSTLGVGETFFIDGENNITNQGVQSNDIITATGPVQVQMLGAACARPHSARAFTLQPEDAWTTEYWAPVPDFADDGAWCNIDDNNYPGDDRDTDIYIHNPHAFPITVTFDDGLGSPTFTVPPETTVSALNTLGIGEFNSAMGVHLSSTDTFWGVSAIDSISGDAYPLSSASNHSDWGYSLIPLSKLSSQAVMGWSPGNGALPPTNDVNGSLAFVSALTDTVVYVDFTQDKRPDVFDMNGDGDSDDWGVFGNPNFNEPTSNLGVPLAAGHVLRVADPNDHDLTGAMIYTSDLSDKIAVAWGQDPCRALQAHPFLDLGYTVLPVPIPSLSKQATSVLDGPTCQVNPGSIISYTMVLHNNGMGPLINGVLTDTLPHAHTDFVVGSITASQPPWLGTIEYYNGITASWNYTPTATPDGDDPAVHAFRLTWPTIDTSNRITVTFQLRLDDDTPISVAEIRNLAMFGSDGTEAILSQDASGPDGSSTACSVGRPILQINKVNDPDPVHPGDLVTYTVAITNTGDSDALDVLILDNLPPHVTYVPGTLDLTLPSIVTHVTPITVPHTTTFDGYYADNFDLTITQTTGYTGSDGSLAWSTDWIEVNDDGNPGTGDVQIGPAINARSPSSHLQLTDDSTNGDSSITRTVDLSDFISPTLHFYVSGLSGPGDTYDVRVNGAPQPGFPERYTGDYQRRTLDLSAYAGQPAITLQFVAQGNMEAPDAYHLDDIVIDEASELRFSTKTIELITSTVTYTTQTGINPLGYDPVTNVMTVTDGVRIPSGAHVRFSFQVQVAIPLTNGLRLTNVAAITSTNVVTNPFPLEDDAQTTVLSDHALTITKQASANVVQPGDLLTYTLTWQVGGDAPAPGVVVTDHLPVPYVSFVSCEGGLGCTNPVSDTVVWELGDRLPVASGDTHDGGQLTLTVRANWPPPPSGIFINTVIIDDATDVPTDTDQVPTIVLSHTLAITKTDNPYDPIAPGQTFTYTIQWAINGQGPAPDVVVTDTLPLDPYVSFNACTGGLTCGETSPGSGVVVWDLGDQLLGGAPSAGGNLSLSVDTSLPLTDSLTFTNHVILDDATSVPPARDDEPTTVLSSHALTITKSGQPGTVYLGQHITYTLLWQVGGDEPAPGVVVTDTIPWQYVSFVSCEGGLGNCDYTAPDTIVWELGDRLPPMSGINQDGGTLSLTVRAEHYPPGGTFTNTVILDDATDVRPSEDDEPTDVYNAGFILSKQLISPTVGIRVEVSKTVQFLIVITNTGAVTLTQLPLVDTYDPIYLEYASAQPAPDAITPTGTLTWNDLTTPPGSDLAPGASTPITVTFKAISHTQSLPLSVTVNTAASEGAQAGLIALPRVQDDADVEIIIGKDAIQLLYLRAGPSSGGVLVEWGTLLEIDTFGFWLHRSDDGQLAHALPVAFIPAQGQFSLGTAYQYLDTSLPPGLYHYWLTEIENNGKQTTYDPVSARPGKNEADLPYRLYLPLIQRK